MQNGHIKRIHRQGSQGTNRRRMTLGEFLPQLLSNGYMDAAARSVGFCGLALRAVGEHALLAAIYFFTSILKK